jgi:tetratricopeptide (TPR) repeat protein
LDPEVYRRLMSRYFELVRGPIERHGGTLEKFIGDAVMAVFGVPDLHEDDALRAVRAAVELRDALRDEEWDPAVAARVGVSTGEVHVLSARDKDLHVSGAAASVASRLEERAPPGEILLSEETYDMVRDAVRAEPADGAWLVEEVLPNAPAYARRLDAPLVGREDELERLRAAYVSARDDARCRVVTVIGEAGIGKTRLARELIASVHDEARVVVGRCISYGEGATYLPIAEIVRQAAPEQTLAGTRTLLGDEEDADAVAQRIAELTGIAETPAAPGEAFWAVRRLFEAMARERPLVVVLDDIHWAEPTLLDLIEYLGEWATGPILVLCLSRRELLETRAAWGGPSSTGFLVELEPLSAETVETLVAQLATDPVDPDVQARIVEHAGGNPLFAEQLLALAAEAPELALEKPPPTVEALLASRLDRLEPRELAVLRRAAVLGRRFSRAELDDLMLDVDASRPLAGLTERGLVHLVKELFRFHHVLVRDVAYRGIPKSERSELHELAARGLDRRDGTDELVGYHFEQAYQYLVELARPDEHTRELAQQGGERLGRAGIRAWQRADVPAALNLLSRARDLLPAPDDVACELGVALNVHGDGERAEEVLLTAQESPEERIRLRARIELEYLRSVTAPNRADELLQIASAAIPRLEAVHDDRALGRAWLTISHVRGGFYCQYGASEEASAKAVGHYRRAGWSPSTALGNYARALFFGPRTVDDALVLCERLLRDHEGDRASEANAVVWMGGLEAMRGRFDEARARVDLAKTIYQDLGLSVAAIDICGQVLGYVEMLAGRPWEAELSLRACCDHLEEIQQTSVLATRAGELADTIAEQGRYADAEAWTQVARDFTGREDLDAQLSWQPVQAKILASRGETREAERLAREALELVRRTDALNRHADVLLVLAEILRLTARRDEAAELVEDALRLYERKGNTVGADRTRALLGEAAIAE